MPSRPSVQQQAHRRRKELRSDDWEDRADIERGKRLRGPDPANPSSLSGGLLGEPIASGRPAIATAAEKRAASRKNAAISGDDRKARSAAAFNGRCKPYRDLHQGRIPFAWRNRGRPTRPLAFLSAVAPGLAILTAIAACVGLSEAFRSYVCYRLSLRTVAPTLSEIDHANAGSKQGKCK